MFKLLQITAILLSNALISFICFNFLHEKLQLSTLTAAGITAAIAATLTVLIALSDGAKCVMLLMLPQLCSKRGRAGLIAFAFLLTLNGPFRNTCNNIKDLSRSLACGQEVLKRAIQDTIGMMKVPFLAIKKIIGNVIASVDRTFEKLEKQLLEMKKLFLSITRVIRKAFSWLGGIINVCNKRIGTPFQRCERMFDEAVKDCRTKLGVAEALCDVTYLVKTFCYTVKFIDYICQMTNFVSRAVLDRIEQRLEKFSNELRVMFYVSVTFDQDFDFETNSTKNISVIATEVGDQIREKTKFLFLYLDAVSLLTGLFFLWIFLRSLLYKNKYLTQNRYDNHYLNELFFEIDQRRKFMRVDSVLPLTKRENQKYVKLTSFTLVASERLRIFKLSIFLFISTMKLGSLVAIDYCFFWLLANIRYHALQEADFDLEPDVSVMVKGNGLVAQLYKDVLEAFKPVMVDFDIDPKHCLPNPTGPDLVVYVKIALLLGLSWLFLFLEPFGQRLRHKVMQYYFPAETQVRTIWLYDHILAKRTDFLKYARRNLGAALRQKPNQRFNERSLLNILRAKTDHIWLFRKILRQDSSVKCMLCGKALKKSEETAVCMAQGCPGRYCFECYVELKHQCLLCMQPMNHGDESGFSEEMGSSDSN